MVNKDDLFIERRKKGDYAVSKPNTQRASGVFSTQKDAIGYANTHKKEGATVRVERVRNTKNGSRDHWRGP